MPFAASLGLRLLAHPRGSAHRTCQARRGAPMMAGIIFVFSAAALLQFFISYCRSLIAASSKQVLSAEVKDVTGIQRAPSGEDYLRVIQLLQLCPERPEDRKRVQAIGVYFKLLSFLRSTIAKMMPAM